MLNVEFLISTATKFLDTFVFATQYLKTSVIFPRLVTVTKIERLQTRMSGDSTLGIQVTELQKELEQHNLSLDSENKLQVIKNGDLLVKK